MTSESFDEKYGKLIDNVNKHFEQLNTPQPAFTTTPVAMYTPPEYKYHLNFELTFDEAVEVFSLLKKMRTVSSE